MRTRKLGNTDLELTTVGLGTWAIGGGDWKFGWGAQDRGDAIAAILRAVELGLNWIDTAAVYGNGQSEQLVGDALKQLGDNHRPIIATKCSRIILDDGNIIARLTPESVKAECDASLQRLGIDAIDLYQMHWPEPEDDIEAGWGAMVDLLNEGKVRNIGVSNFNVQQMKRLQPIHPIASLQPPYSMIARGVENEILEFCADNNIGVVCYSPMCKGLLTGTMTPERAGQLDESDHRRRDPKFNPPQLDVHLALIDVLRPIAERHRRSLAELAIAWVLRRVEVTSAIVGARRPAQIEGTAAAGDWSLGADDIAEIDGLLAQHAETLLRLGATDLGRI